MKRIPPALAALVLLVAGCEAIDAPPAPGAGAVPEAAAAPATPGYEPPAPGTIAVVRHEGGRLESSRVLGSEGYALAMMREGERVVELPFCLGCAPPPGDRIEIAAYQTLWPLAVGKSASFERRRGEGAGDIFVHEVAVTGEETVETDFGPVETLVVEETVTRPADPGWRATRRQWFSPRLGWTVRSEWDAPEGSGRWEVAALALPQ